ncbi:MAG: hypothetical protein OXC28_04940 [Defluviicoccus sp.]|nr:hypothetical protein [Defluviicoccus sp.]
MTSYEINLLYDVCFGATVTVEADSVEETCRLAIEQPDDAEAWKSTDHASDAYVHEILATDRPEPPYGDATPVPVPEAYTRDGPPPTVTLYGEPPPGSVEVSDGTVRLRFVHPRFAVTRELPDPAPPAGARPVVTVARRHDGTPDVSVSGAAHVRIVGWNDPDAPPSSA